jgi:hypothetical protein
MQNKKSGYALVCFYHASIGGHGAAEVTMSLYDCLPNTNKKLFEIKKNKFFYFLEKYKFNYFENLYKFFYIFYLIKKIIFFFKKYNKKIIIIEGASWIGYSYILIKVIRLFYPNFKLIYHAHNIEYFLRRKKNSLLISFLTKILEKKVYNLVDCGTSVSRQDQKDLKKLYKIRSVIFENGINRKRLLIEKPKYNFPSKFIIYTGSYSFFPNKIAIDLLIYKILPKILKKNPDIKLVITGRDMPRNKIQKYKFIRFYPNIKKQELNYLIIKSLFLLAPLTKGPGTKLKIIETLMLGANLITSKNGMKGIARYKNNNLFIFSNLKRMHKYINFIIKNYKYIKKKNNNKIYLKKYLMENIVKSFFKKINLHANIQKN